MKTSELIGGRLDYWVAKAEGRTVDYHDSGAHGGDFVTVVDAEQSGWVSWSPSRAWADGGPIIEREPLDIISNGPGEWAAGYALESWQVEMHRCSYGPTPLIAAMRAYVESKFGKDVAELP